MPAKSKEQQRLMGQAYALKTGKKKKSDLNPEYADEIAKLSKSMTKKQLKDFAKTKHKDIKEKKIQSFQSFINESNEDSKLIGGFENLPNSPNEDSKLIGGFENLPKSPVKVKHLIEYLQQFGEETSVELDKDGWDSEDPMEAIEFSGLFQKFKDTLFINN